MFEIIDQHSFDDGQIIWEEGSHGDWIYLIESGQVELSKAVRGERVVVDVLKADDIMGEVEYIADHPRLFTAKSIGETRLGIIDRNFLDDEYNRLPENFKAIMRSMAARLTRACENVNLGRKSQRRDKSFSLIFETKESLVKAVTANASEQGLMIETPDPLPKGDKFPLQLQLPEDPEPVEIECEVIWSHPASADHVGRATGMGVKFVKISGEDKERLSRELKRKE